MYKLNIKFNAVYGVSDFARIVSMIPEDVTVKSDKYVVDGKSVMGLFSLDLSKPVIVECDNKDILSLLNDYKYTK